MYCPQSLDLRSQVRLGIEPGSGDASTFRDGLEGDRLTRRVEGAEGLDGLGAGVLAAAPGGVNDVLAVFSSHRGLLRLSGGVFQTGDDLLKVAEDLAIHLGHACLAAGLGGRDDLQQLLPLLVVLRQELGGGDKHRAGQAGIGLRTCPLHRQAAVAVGQGLGHAPESLLWRREGPRVSPCVVVCGSPRRGRRRVEKGLDFVVGERTPFGGSLVLAGVGDRVPLVEKLRVVP